ncbi:MAG: PleD family two-component system response regulator [Candidatus Methylacidiphilales bacterium]|nr:response regulator [Candidatus Methylacidiphilales bacterium]
MSSPKNKIILAIDDSLTLRKFIERSLMNEGLCQKIVMASDAASGLALAKTLKPDLIICDYILPDGQGDEVCARLLETPSTAHVPVILMSSSGPEIKQVQSQYSNIASALVKPFTKELLVATVAYALSAAEEAAMHHGTPVVPQSTAVRFRGRSSSFPIPAALRSIEHDKLTGVLRAYISQEPIQAYFQEGHVRVVTTRDVHLYLDGSPFDYTGRKNDIWEACEERQTTTQWPFLLLLAEHGVLASQMAVTLTEVYGHRLFAQLWARPDVLFEFEELDTLPPFVSLMRVKLTSMDNWMLENLRAVERVQAIGKILEDPQGVPSFTAAGFANIRRVKLSREEDDFVALVSGTTTFAEIHQELRQPADVTAHILFRFIQLGFLDFWSSSLFAAVVDYPEPQVTELEGLSVVEDDDDSLSEPEAHLRSAPAA